MHKYESLEFVWRCMGLIVQEQGSKGCSGPHDYKEPSAAFDTVAVDTIQMVRIVCQSLQANTHTFFLSRLMAGRMASMLPCSLTILSAVLGPTPLMLGR